MQECWLPFSVTAYAILAQNPPTSRSSAAASDDCGHIVRAAGIGLFGGGSLLFKDSLMSPDNGDPELCVPLLIAVLQALQGKGSS